MTEPSRPEPLAHRHRHAWLLATLTELIGGLRTGRG